MKQGTLTKEKRITIHNEQPGARFEVILNAFKNPSILEVVNPHPLKIELKLIFTREGSDKPEEVSFSIHPPVLEPICSLPLNMEGKKAPGPVVIVREIYRISSE